MTRILSLFVMFMLFGVLAFAQNRVVTGTVTDEKGNAVEAASIRVVGTRIGTATDQNGSYRLANVAPGSIIRVSSVGVTQQDVTVGASGPVNIVVAKTAGTELNAVTVVTTANNIRRQPKELGYAATTLTNKTITAGKAVGVAQALNGKVSSVSVSTTSSSVFEAATIRIRGIRSLTGNNDPMLVVDGAPTPLSYLSSIAPEDIATETLLKGATAAAIYGPEGANGVIIINTKRGTGDGSLQVSISSSVQLTKVAFFPKLQHMYGQGAGEVINVDGSYGYVPYENQLYGPQFDGTTQDIGVRLEDGSIQSGPYSNLHATDKKNFYNTGSTLQNNISISGKEFFLSIDDAIIHGTVPDDKLRRTSFRFNGGKNVNKFSASYGINYVLQNYNVLNENALASLSPTSYGGGLFFQILQTADNIPLLQYKDWQNNKYAQYSNYYNEFATNPYWAIGNLRQTGRSDQFLGNVELGYQLAPWLKATARANTDLSFTSFENTTAPVNVTAYAQAHRSTTQYSNKPGSVVNGITNSNRINFDGFLSGETGVAKNFRVSYLGGGQVRQNRSRTEQIGGNNLVVPYLFNPVVRTGDAAVAATQTQSTSYSLYGSLGLKYHDYAFVEFTGRNDWDSRLLPNNRIFFYPGVNASFVLSDAAPSIKNKVLNFAKIRGSYVKSGNVNLNPYQLNATYAPPGGFPYPNTVGFSAGGLIPDKNLTPEFQLTSEVGMELGFLKNNRIYFEATYYNSDNKDQILTVTKPSSTGYQAALANAAEFKNYGVDLDLTLSPLVNIGRARLDLKMNAGYNNNQVLHTFQDLPVFTGGSANFIQNSVSSPTITQVAQVGGPAYAYQLTDYNRDDQGRVIVDANGNPTQANALRIMGRSLPLWTIGVTPAVTIGNFQMSMTWDFKGGHNAYSGLGSDMDFSGISARSADYGRQSFIFPNSVYDDGTGKYVVNTDRLTQDGNYAFWTGKTTNTGIATNYFYSAAALRLREVNLSYNWAINGKGLKNLTFSIVGRNLFLFVPKSNQWGDPEFNSGGANTYGISSSFQSPATRLLGLSVKAQF